MAFEFLSVPAGVEEKKNLQLFVAVFCVFICSLILLFLSDCSLTAIKFGILQFGVQSELIRS